MSYPAFASGSQRLGPAAGAWRLGVRVVVAGLGIVLLGCPGGLRPRGARPATAESAAGVVSDTGNAIDLPRALVAHCDGARRLAPTDDPYARFEQCAQDDAQYRRRRTQLQERLIAASNERCAEYKERLQQVQVQAQPPADEKGSDAVGAASAALGVLTVAYPPAAAVSGLLGAAQLVYGVRATPPKQFTSGLTVQVVSLGIDTRRAGILQGIRGRQDEDPASYPVEAAVADALLYHQACSMVAGLEAAGEALATNDPAVARVRAEFATDAAATAVSSIARARLQVDVDRQRITTATSAAPPGSVDVERAAAEQATHAAADVADSRAAEAAGAKRRIETLRRQLAGTGDPRRRNQLAGELDGEVTRAVRASVEVDEAMERARAAVEALEARAAQAVRAAAAVPPAAAVPDRVDDEPSYTPAR